MMSMHTPYENHHHHPQSFLLHVHLTKTHLQKTPNQLNKQKTKSAERPVHENSSQLFIIPSHSTQVKQIWCFQTRDASEMKLKLTCLYVIYESQNMLSQRARFRNRHVIPFLWSARKQWSQVRKADQWLSGAGMKECGSLPGWRWKERDKWYKSVISIFLYVICSLVHLMQKWDSFCISNQKIRDSIQLTELL